MPVLYFVKDDNPSAIEIIFFVEIEISTSKVTNIFPTNKQYLKIKLMQHETNMLSRFLVKTKFW